MCRLYGFRSTVPRKVECELIQAQNALIRQSRRDERGKANADGWGLATYRNGEPEVVRQASPAYEDEQFRWQAARIHCTTVLAHVRHATVGEPRIENTHPFRYGRWLLAHNGHLAAFEALRPRLLEHMSATHRAAIEGTTDSEHVFHFLLSLHERDPDRPLAEVMQAGLRQIMAWSEEADPTAEVALNLLWTNGADLLASRLNRTLWYVQRDRVHPCDVDGALHVEDDPGDDYRAVVIASERITRNEDWVEVPEGTILHVDADVRLHRCRL